MHSKVSAAPGQAPGLNRLSRGPKGCTKGPGERFEEDQLEFSQSGAEGLCWLLRTSVHENRRPALYYRSPLLHCLHKEMLVPKNRERASLCSMHTQVAAWANRQKDGVFSLSVEGKQGSESHNVQES